MLYILLAEGFEETEMIAPLDILRRAEIPVQTVGITGKTVTGTHGISICADILPAEAEPSSIDGVILPGGMPGTRNLQRSEVVQSWVSRCAKEKKLLAAICAAPLIFGELELLRGRKVVCFPGFEESLYGAEITENFVERSENIITARGAGAALEFGAAIVNYIKKDGSGNEILAQMQTSGYAKV